MRFDLRNYKSLKSIVFSVIFFILISNNTNKLLEVMAWRSHGRSNIEMVQNLKSRSSLTSILFINY